MTFHPSLGFGFAIALSCLTIAGCTGAPSTTDGPSGTAGTVVTIDVVDSRGNPANGQAAAQIGNESWTSVVPVEIGRYEIVVPDDETRYGFVVNCPSGLLASSTKVMGHRSTVQEATELLVTCPVAFTGATTTIEGVFDATAVNADSVVLRTDVDQFDGPAGTPQDVFGPVVATVGLDRAIVGVALDSAGKALAVKVIRNLDLAAAASVSVTFSVADSVSFFLTPDFSSSVPGGFFPDVALGLVLSSGERISLDSEFTANPTVLRAFPNIQPGDLYAIAATASGPNAIGLATIHYRDSLAGIDLTLPQPWSPAPDVVGTALPTYSGLMPLPGDTNFRGHLLVHGWDGIPPHATKPDLPLSSGIVQVFVTDGWLGGTTEVATPDLTNLDGFEGAKPLPGETVYWYIFSFASNIDTQTLLSSPAYPREFNTGLLTPYPPPVGNGTSARVALVQGDYTVP